MSEARPEKNPAGAPSRPRATAVLNTAPPACGEKQASPAAVWRGSMSISASPQHRIIASPSALHPRIVGS